MGLRLRTYHVLSGSVLAVWARVEAVLAQRSQLNKMQVVRIKTDEGLKIVGRYLFFYVSGSVRYPASRGLSATN